MCGRLNILCHCLSLGLEWKLTFSCPVATAEFFIFVVILTNSPPKSCSQVNCLVMYVSLMVWHSCLFLKCELPSTLEGHKDNWARNLESYIWFCLNHSRVSLVSQMVKNLSAMQETKVWSLLGKIPWRREWLPTLEFLPGKSHRQRCLTATVHGSQTVGHDWAIKHIR